MRLKIATLDLETDPFERHLHPKAFAAGYTESTKSSKVAIFWGKDCCKDLIELMDHRAKATKDRLCVYAHNGGKFDFFFLMKPLRDKYGASGLKVSTIGSRIVKITVGENKEITYKGRKQKMFVALYEMRDSYALIPKRLADIGIKDSIDIWLMHRDKREANKEEIIKYLRQDCVGLYDALKEFLDLYPRKLTLASTAFAVLKKHFNVPNMKTTESYDREYRNYYFAGRVEFFDLGKLGKRDGQTRFRMVDINSAFPAAMLDDHFYCSNPIISKKIPDDEYTKLRSFYHINARSHGALPIRRNGIHFPRTRTDFFCSGWELFKGIELGLVEIFKVYKVTSPTTTQSFADYINHYYELKRTAETESERNFAKLFLNTVYGKYSQDSYKFRDVRLTELWEKPKPHPVRMEDNTMLKVSYNKHYQDDASGVAYWSKPSNIEGQDKEVSFINVLTAASITGHVRAKMMQALYTARNPIYCDTDSILAQGIEGFPLSDKLGDWGVDGCFDQVFIGGKKLYALHRSQEDWNTKKKGEWKTACKGVRLTPEQICDVAEGQQVEYEFDAPNFSPFSKPSFISRKINRADKRKTTNVLESDSELEDILKHS